MGSGGAAAESANDSNGNTDSPHQNGTATFKRQNPMTDRFGIKRFHHVEFWCADASSTSKRYAIIKHVAIHAINIYSPKIDDIMYPCPPFIAAFVMSQQDTACLYGDKCYSRIHRPSRGGIA